MRVTRIKNTVRALQQATRLTPARGSEPANRATQGQMAQGPCTSGVGDSWGECGPVRAGTAMGRQEGHQRGWNPPHSHGQAPCARRPEIPAHLLVLASLLHWEAHLPCFWNPRHGQGTRMQLPTVRVKECQAVGARRGQMCLRRSRDREEGWEGHRHVEAMTGEGQRPKTEWPRLEDQRHTHTRETSRTRGLAMTEAVLV